MTKTKKQLVTASVILLMAILFYLIMAVVSVNRSVEAFNTGYYPVTTSDHDDTINKCSIPGYMDLLRKKAYLSAQVKMAGSDSIGMLINMPDSLIQLMIKGVAIRSVKMSSYETSPFFRRVDQEALYNLLSSPLPVKQMSASFPKEPIHVKIAPQDTSEVITEAKPDTTDFEAVFFTLDTDVLRFYFEQQEDTIRADRRARLRFDMHKRLSDAAISARSIFSFRVPAYKPYIKIWIPKSEAKIIYRALPYEGDITLMQ